MPKNRPPSNLATPLVALAPPDPAPAPEPTPAPEDGGDDGVDLFALAHGGAAVPSLLEEIKIGRNPVCFALFMARGVPVRLHYEEHESHRGYHHCLSEAMCPVCLAGQKPTDFLLIPAYDFAAKRVGFVRASTAEGPHRLWSLLRVHIGQPGLAGSFFTAHRDDKNRYHLLVAPIPHEADRGLPLIRQFLADWQARRVDLKAGYPTHAAEELAQIPAIRAYLELHGLLPEQAQAFEVGDWPEPEVPASEEGQGDAAAA